MTLLVVLAYLVSTWAVTAQVTCPVQDIVCTAGTTCCPAAYADTGYGCCPYSNAVCCPNKQTCCEAGSTCVDDGAYLTTCTAMSGNKTGLSVCKTGPITPPSTILPNVMIMGDSVSLGYTPHVSSGLATKGQVVHTPNGGDGGAEETAYGIQCLDFFLASSLQKPYPANVILFNWGLHNYGNSTVPGQGGPASEYRPQLQEIVTKLSAYAKSKNIKLLWASTTPVPSSTVDNDVVVKLNGEASDIMTKFDIPQVDLYSQVIKYCGPVPYWNCDLSLNTMGQPNVHYTDKGYQYLASFLVPVIEKVLAA